MDDYEVVIVCSKRNVAGGSVGSDEKGSMLKLLDRVQSTEEGEGGEAY